MISGRNNWKTIVMHYLYKREKGICGLCLEFIPPNDRVEIDHKIQVCEGGSDEMENLRLVHYACHKNRHRRRLPTITDMPLPNYGIKNVRVAHAYGERALLATLRTALMANSGNITAASQAVGLSRFTVSRIAKKHGLALKDYQSWQL